MLTIKRLKELIENLPDEVQVVAYEGESAGLTLSLGDKYGFIHTGWDSDTTDDETQHDIAQLVKGSGLRQDRRRCSRLSSEVEENKTAQAKEGKEVIGQTVRTGDGKFVTISADSKCSQPFSIGGRDESGDEFFLWLSEEKFRELRNAIEKLKLETLG